MENYTSGNLLESGICILNMNNSYDDIKILKDNLPIVNEIINQELTTSEIEFSDSIKKYFNNRAKLLRPALTLIASSYRNTIGEKELKCAAAMEMLHVASLIHDDIIDDAKTRRGIETLNSSHSVGFALICGDYLFSKSYEMLFSINNYKALNYVGSNTVNMCFGEIEQYLKREKRIEDIEEYFSIIDKKTASLFQTNLFAGAMLTSMRKKEVDDLIEFGKYFGRVFQIIDDVNDFTQELSEAGKPVMHDIDNGTYSLPMIVAGIENSKIYEYAKSSEKQLVNQIIDETNAIEISRDYAKEFYNKAKEYALENKELSDSLIYFLDKIYYKKS